MFLSRRQLRTSDKQILVNPFVVADADVVVVKDSSKHHVTWLSGLRVLTSGVSFNPMSGSQTGHQVVVTGIVHNPSNNHFRWYWFDIIQILLWKDFWHFNGVFEKPPFKSNSDLFNKFPLFVNKKYCNLPVFFISNISKIFRCMHALF